MITSWADWEKSDKRTCLDCGKVSEIADLFCNRICIDCYDKRQREEHFSCVHCEQIMTACTVYCVWPLYCDDPTSPNYKKGSKPKMMSPGGVFFKDKIK